MPGKKAIAVQKMLRNLFALNFFQVVASSGLSDFSVLFIELFTNTILWIAKTKYKYIKLSLK